MSLEEKDSRDRLRKKLETNNTSCLNSTIEVKDVSLEGDS